MTAGLITADPTHAMTECEFIQRTMNKLGSRMSILCLRIDSVVDPAIQDAASKQLQSDTDDFRLAKSNMNAPIEEMIAGVATNESR